MDQGTTASRSHWERMRQEVKEAGTKGIKAYAAALGRMEANARDIIASEPSGDHLRWIGDDLDRIESYRSMVQHIQRQAQSLCGELAEIQMTPQTRRDNGPVCKALTHLVVSIEAIRESFPATKSQLAIPRGKLQSYASVFTHLNDGGPIKPAHMPTVTNAKNALVELSGPLWGVDYIAESNQGKER